jgi:hypothetical protein
MPEELQKMQNRLKNQAAMRLTLIRTRTKSYFKQHPKISAVIGSILMLPIAASIVIWWYIGILPSDPMQPEIINWIKKVLGSGVALILILAIAVTWSKTYQFIIKKGSKNHE